MSDNALQSVVQTAVAAGLPTLSVLVGILINNSRLNDVRSDMREIQRQTREDLRNLRQDLRDVRQDLIDRLQRVEEVMDARLKHLEERQ